MDRAIGNTQLTGYFSVGLLPGFFFTFNERGGVLQTRDDMNTPRPKD